MNLTKSLLNQFYHPLKLINKLKRLNELNKEQHGEQKNNERGRSGDRGYWSR